MQKKRGFTLLLVVLAMVFAFSAVNAQEPTTFNGGWPYQPPPTGHFNQFAANNIIALGAYYPITNPPLAVYHWATGEYEGYLADTFGFDAGQQLRRHPQTRVDVERWLPG